jgi:hypothetical protein
MVTTQAKELESQKNLNVEKLKQFSILQNRQRNSEKWTSSLETRLKKIIKHTKNKKYAMTTLNYTDNERKQTKSLIRKGMI